MGSLRSSRNRQKNEIPLFVKDLGKPGLPLIQSSFYQIANLRHYSGHFLKGLDERGEQSAGLPIHRREFFFLDCFLAYFLIFGSQIITISSPKERCQQLHIKEITWHIVNMVYHRISFCVLVSSVLGSQVTNTIGDYTILSGSSFNQILLVMAFQNGHTWKNWLVRR